MEQAIPGSRSNRTNVEDGAADLDRAGTAAYWGVSVRTIDRWVAEGVLRSVRIGGVRRFRRSDFPH